MARVWELGCCCLKGERWSRWMGREGGVELTGSHGLIWVGFITCKVRERDEVCYIWEEREMAGWG